MWLKPHLIHSPITWTKTWFKKIKAKEEKLKIYLFNANFLKVKSWWLISHLTSMAVSGYVLSGWTHIGVIGRQGGADLPVDEGVEADVRAPTTAALAHWAVVLPQEIVNLPCNETKGYCLVYWDTGRKFHGSWDLITHKKIIREKKITLLFLASHL